MAWVEPKGDKFRGMYRDPEGVRRSTPVRTSKRAALRDANDKEAEVRSGVWFDPVAGKMTLKQYVEDPTYGWLALRSAEINTHTTYRSMWNMVEPRLGHLELRRITSSVMQRWVKDMEDDPDLSPKTLVNRFIFVQSVLAARKGVSAMRDGKIQHNPCSGVQLPHVPKREVTIYTPEESDRIIAAMPRSGGRWRSSGLRPGCGGASSWACGSRTSSSTTAP